MQGSAGELLRISGQKKDPHPAERWKIRSTIHRYYLACSAYAQRATTGAGASGVGGSVLAVAVRALRAIIIAIVLVIASLLPIYLPPCEKRGREHSTVFFSHVKRFF